MAEKKFDIVLRAKDKFSGVMNQATVKANRFSKALQNANLHIKKSQQAHLVFARSLKSVGDSMVNMGRTMTTMFTLPVAAGIAYSVKKFADFETALLQVSESTGLSGGALNNLGSEVLKLTRIIPKTSTDLLEFSSAAGKIGVKSTPEILKITEVMGRLSSITDLSGESALYSLNNILKFANEPISDLEKLGNTIALIDDAFGIKEASKLTEATSEIQKKLSGSLKISSKDAMALGAVFTSLEIDAGKAGQSMGKIFGSVREAISGKGKSKDLLAQLTGINKKDLGKTLKDDAFGLFTKLAKGINKAGKEGKDTSKIFKDLGLNAFKKDSVLSLLVSRYDEVSRAIDLLNDKQSLSNSLLEESERKTATLNGQMILLSNRLSEVATRIGNKLAPVIRDNLIPALDRLFKFFEKNPKVAKFIAIFAGIMAVLGPVLIVLGMMATSVGGIITTLSALGALFGVTFGTIMIVIGLAIASVAAFAAWAYTVYSKWDEVKKLFIDLWNDPIKSISKFLYYASGIGFIADEIIAHWEPIKNFFAGLWEGPIKDALRIYAHYSGIAKVANLIKSNWAPIKSLMSSIWTEATRAYVVFKDTILSTIDSIKNALTFDGISGMFGGGANPKAKIFDQSSFVGPMPKTKTSSLGPSKLGPSKPPTMISGASKTINQVNTNNAAITVDFKNVPKGTAVAATKNEGNALNMKLGYANTGLA